MEMLARCVRQPALATPGISAVLSLVLSNDNKQVLFFYGPFVYLSVAVFVQSDRVSEGKTLASVVRKPARATPGVSASRK
jgi:hypothetical protein